jgi:flagellar protein FlaJ
MRYVERAGLHPETYKKKILLPVVVLAAVAALVMLLFVVPLLSLLGPISYLVMTVPVFIVIVGLLYPKIIADSRRNEINNNLHFYITNLGVLSTSEVDRKTVMRLLSEKKEYKELAKETGKLYVIMEKWGRSLAQACRFLAKRTPSEIFADFLDRFAHSLDSGESMDSFLKKEQTVVMSDYATVYRGKLYDIDVFKEIYISIILSIAFFASFAMIVPFITGQSLKFFVIMIAFILMSTEVAIVYFLKNKVPEDNIWHTSEIVTDVDRMLLKRLVISIVSCGAVVAAYYFISPVFGISIPFEFVVSLSLTPLIIAGMTVRKEEEKIKRKDLNFPSFLRSLGGSASARGRQILESMKYLTAHDFGPLTEDIQNLYKRLCTRLNNDYAWRLFSVDTGSNLIYRFVEMFVESIRLGSEPEEVADIIADNFTKINELRKQRFQTTASYIGLSYGLIVGVAFALFVSFGIAKGINEMYLSMNITSEFVQNIIYTTPKEDLSWVFNLIYFVLIGHSFLAAISIRITDGGHLMNSLNHFVGMVWVSSVIVYIASKVMVNMLSFGS